MTAPEMKRSSEGVHWASKEDKYGIRSEVGRRDRSGNGVSVGRERDGGGEGTGVGGEAIGT